MSSGFSKTDSPDTARIPNPGVQSDPFSSGSYSQVGGRDVAVVATPTRGFLRICSGSSQGSVPETSHSLAGMDLKPVFSSLLFPPDWPYSKGFVTADMIQEHLPAPAEDVLLLLCGPPPMVQLACHPNLDKLGYSQKMRFTY